jgi:oligoendopeptidase F
MTFEPTFLPRFPEREQRLRPDVAIGPLTGHHLVMDATHAEQDSTPPRWDLTWIAPAIDHPDFQKAEESTSARVQRLASHFEAHDLRGGPPIAPDAEGAQQLAATLDLINQALAEVRDIRAVVHGNVTQDVTDDVAASAQDRLRTELTSPLNVLLTRFDAYCARLDLPALATLEPTVADHLHPLERGVAAADHQMSETEEQLAADLALTGSAAWVRLHGDICGRLTGTLAADSPSALAGQTLPMTRLRALGTNNDPATRRAAYDAEIAAWESVTVPLAACLNSQKGESITLNRRRGWPDDLAPALFNNAIDAATLDAMTQEVVESLPDFRRYLTAKARLVNGDDKLPWCDVLAPMGAAADGVPWDQAMDTVQSAFGDFSNPLRALAERAVSEQWIDAEPRAGKAGGAFCMPVANDVSRILMTFDGSADAMQTLAHELGHAYHNTLLGTRPWLQRSTPSCLAETASIFCETLVVQSLLSSAPAEVRLGLLDTDLQGATQVIVDIHSRFLFESELYRRRASGTLSVDELCGLMNECQQAAYGDAVTELHPYMWAVKAHYFTPFYNFPYTFGLLFGLGLYAVYERDPDHFRGNYDSLLGATGLADAADLASRFDIDITDRAFWRSSLDVLRTRIDEFCRLASDN